uniref:C-type lectin domain-containing protein n=1 Tax=Chelonoidis abingdonii TaxID=106734 RepID=A0A8C0J211_CHEAB
RAKPILLDLCQGSRESQSLGCWGSFLPTDGQVPSYTMCYCLISVLSERSSTALGPWCPKCLDGWIGYRGKCYYFSEAKGNWTNSQKHCSSFAASLAAIDTQQDMDFLLRYKGKFDHWIGLRRDLGQPWKWANGTEFNNLFLITADGDCAYLTENSVSSLRCTSERYWICAKPDPFTKAKGG